MGVIHDRAMMAKKLLVGISQKRKIGMKDILSRDTSRHIVAVRREFCKRANELGVGIVILGKILDRHHTTLLPYINPEFARRKSAYHAARHAERNADRN